MEKLEAGDRATQQVTTKEKEKKRPGDSVEEAKSLYNTGEN